jgi:hypothetical protein
MSNIELQIGYENGRQERSFFDAKDSKFKD